MRPRFARSPALVPLALLSLNSVAKASFLERPSEIIPENIAKVVALDEGGALLLGFNDLKEEEDFLVRIGQGGSPAIVKHPPVGTLLDIAVRGPEVWVLGSEGILYSNGLNAWTSIALPDSVVCSGGRYITPGGGHSLSDVRNSNILAIERMRSAITCTDVKAEQLSTNALIIRADGGLEARFTFKEVALGLLVADGAGGLWTYVDSREGAHVLGLGILGYARYSQGLWSIWSSGKIDPVGFDQKNRREMRDRAYFASEDGSGGYWLVHNGGAWTHARSTGDHVVTLPPFGDPGPAAYDNRTGVLLGFANGFRYLDTGHLGELLRIGADETVLSQQRLSIWPSGRKMRPGFYMAIESMSSGREGLWLAASSFVEHETKAGRTVYWAPAVTAFHEQESHRAEWAAALVAALLCSTIGLLTSARLQRERRWTGVYQTLSGAIASAIPLLFFYDDIELFVQGGILGCLEGNPYSIFYALPAGASATLGGLAVFVVGESVRRSQRKGRALLGAVAGAIGGILLAAGLFALLLASFNVPGGVPVGANLGLIGTGATIAYQWAGGGRRS